MIENKIPIDAALRSPILMKKFHVIIDDLTAKLDAAFWRSLKDLVNILLPIATAILIAESDENFIGIVFEKIDSCFNLIEDVLDASTLSSSFITDVKAVGIAPLFLLFLSFLVCR